MEGLYQTTVDSCGQLILPTEVRKELGGVFYVTIFAENCLAVYSTEQWKGLLDKLAALQRTTQQELRPIFENAVGYEADKRGYVLIPQNLREFTGITTNVTIVSRGDKYELWDSSNWDKHGKSLH